MPTCMIGWFAQVRPVWSRRVSPFVATVPLLTVTASALGAPPEVIPMGGNAYLTSSAEGSQDRINRRGALRWQDETSGFSAYFHVDRPTALEVSLLTVAVEQPATLAITINGQEFTKELAAGPETTTPVGRIELKAAGYVRVDLKGVKKAGEFFPEVQSLQVTPSEAEAKFSYVRNNDGNDFYWGRRGPSVHLGFQTPKDQPLEYFYSEITVPKGQDPIGSYFMANGFAEGYFGFQVNSDVERRVLFSVWSPFNTDNPKDIPADQRIGMLKKGEGVHTGEFGNEGSGGQSFLNFPWKTGETYRFLNRARPDGKGATDYTAWFFAPEENRWRLIASFKRPQTNTTLRGIHSFLENFSDRNGWIERGAFYGNQWARTVDGQWIELTDAHFSGDAIANKGARVDYAGGVKDGRFFMRNGGYALETVPLRSRFKRPESPSGPPKIDFAALDDAR